MKMSVIYVHANVPVEATVRYLCHSFVITLITLFVNVFVSESLLH